MKRLRISFVTFYLTMLPVVQVNAAPADETSSATTLADQTDVAVTVYNVNLGLVRDRRELTLPKGRRELRFMDVASQIIPASVHIASVSDPASLRVLEQNYEFDLLNPQKLMDKFIGKEIKLYQINQYTEREETVSATLMANNGSPVYRIGNDITFNYPGRVILPDVPESLIAKPTLVWLLENDRVEPQTVEASYLTNGINWRSDYVLTLNASDDRADLTGWVTIDNKSGAAFVNAKLKLVAGDVNRVQEEAGGVGRKVMRRAMAEPVPAQFKEQEFFEYHLYTLERTTTIKDNQAKQISLVTADSFPAKKELVFRGQNYYYYSPAAEMPVNQKVSVYVEFENKKAQGLGIPLPKGTVRVYKRDTDNMLQFIGEDVIDHTPRDEKVRVKLGEAFDVVGSRKQTDWKKLASDSYEAAFEITLRNHKQEDVTVKVIEPIPGDWQMVDSSHKYTKNEAFTAEFLVPVEKNGEAKLSYRVRMRW
jgi:hypothetical protein